MVNPACGIFFLARKFKIAVIGPRQDRVALQVHDIGLQIVKNSAGNTGLKEQSKPHYPGGKRGLTVNK
jgi:sulfite reductase beta subunit-like hemoprotein